VFCPFAVGQGFHSSDGFPAASRQQLVEVVGTQQDASPEAMRSHVSLGNQAPNVTHGRAEVLGSTRHIER
jgi:hypothetical protein